MRHWLLSSLSSTRPLSDHYSGFVVLLQFVLIRILLYSVGTEGWTDKILIYFKENSCLYSYRVVAQNSLRNGGCLHFRTLNTKDLTLCTTFDHLLILLFPDSVFLGPPPLPSPVLPSSQLVWNTLVQNMLLVLFSFDTNVQKGPEIIRFWCHHWTLHTSEGSALQLPTTSSDCLCTRSLLLLHIQPLQEQTWNKLLIEARHFYSFKKQILCVLEITFLYLSPEWI